MLERVRDAEGCGRATPDRSAAEPKAARPVATGWSLSGVEGHPWLPATPDTNRKIDAGKKQWDDKFKTFLTSKQNWQDEIKAAAMEQSLEKMLGATGSALNERLKALSANINIPVDVPEINVASLVHAAMADFDRSKPSSERIFGEINKSITAFNVTLELGNATHFKGFNSTSLEGDFASNMETFSKKMTILNNVKMYESFKKLIEDFKESLRKNDKNVTAALTTAATLANYRESGGRYAKDMGWAMGGKYSFSAYAHADVDGLMDRGMREAGMKIMSGEDMVKFLEGGRDVDVKLFFDVQTMALEQAFKIVGGDKSKKGLYGEYVGEQPQYNKSGDESSQGSGELGGWTSGQMVNDKTYRGLNKEEKRLATYQGTWNAAIGVTAGLAAAATGNVYALATIAGIQATHSTASNIAVGRDVGGTLAMGAIDFGIAFGGALMGPGVAATAVRSSLNFARAGIAQKPDGTVNLDFKGNWSSGAGASAAFSGAMSVLGEAAGGSIGKTNGKGWGALVNGAFDAIGSGVKFDSGGISGFSAAAAIGSGVGSAVAYGLNPGKTASESLFGGGLKNQVLASELSRLAGAITTTIVGAATKDNAASNAFIGSYANQNGFSALGGILGRALQVKMEENRTLDAARQAKETGQPLTQEMLGALALIAARRRDEETAENAENGIGGDDFAEGGADDAAVGLRIGGASIEEVELLKDHFKKNTKFGVEDKLLTELVESGTLSEGDAAEIVAAQVESFKRTETKAERFVPTKDPDGLFDKLAKDFGVSKEEILLRWVPANTGDEHDISTPEGFEAAQQALYAKLNKGGTINVPQGLGEYTAAFDKRQGYDKVRAERAAAAMAQLSNTAGLGGNNQWLLGTDSITGRQQLNLTPDQVRQFELGMVNVNRAVQKENAIDQRLYGTSLSNGIDPLFMQNNGFVRMSFTGKTPVEMLTKPQVVTERLTFTGWEQVPNPANIQAFKALSANTEVNLALGMANAVSVASGVRAAYMLAKLGYAGLKAGATAAATEQLTPIQATGLLTGNWAQAGVTPVATLQSASVAAGTGTSGGILKTLFPNPVTQVTYGGVNAMGSAYWDMKQTGSINPVNSLISFGTGALTSPGGYPTKTLTGAFAYNAAWGGLGNITSQVISNGGIGNFSVPQFTFQTAFSGLSGVTQQMIGQSAALSGANQIQRWRDEGMNMGLWWYSPLIAPK